jgi:uncharacterized protein (TIGR02598 family)
MIYIVTTFEKHLDQKHHSHLRSPYVKPSPSHPTRLRKTSGFSLVEVTMALGIIAFSFLTLLGLLQTGLNVFRGSIDRTLAAQISQQILNEKQQTDFTALLAEISPSYRCFSDEGDELRDVKDKNKTIYLARVEIAPATDVPSQGGEAFRNISLAKVTVTIVHQPGGDEKKARWADPQATRYFTSYIPKM